MFGLMALFGLAMFVFVGVHWRWRFWRSLRSDSAALRLAMLPLKLLAFPFIAVALLVKFAFLIAIGSVVVALLIPLAILAILIGARRSQSFRRLREVGRDSCVARITHDQRNTDHRR